jgi:hypothetical protein
METNCIITAAFKSPLRPEPCCLIESVNRRCMCRLPITQRSYLHVLLACITGHCDAFATLTSSAFRFAMRGKHSASHETT